MEVDNLYYALARKAPSLVRESAHDHVSAAFGDIGDPPRYGAARDIRERLRFWKQVIDHCVHLCVPARNTPYTKPNYGRHKTWRSRFRWAVGAHTLKDGKRGSWTCPREPLFGNGRWNGSFACHVCKTRVAAGHKPSRSIGFRSSI